MWLASTSSQHKEERFRIQLFLHHLREVLDSALWETQSEKGAHIHGTACGYQSKSSRTLSQCWKLTKRTQYFIKLNMHIMCRWKGLERMWEMHNLQYISLGLIRSYSMSLLIKTLINNKIMHERISICGLQISSVTVSSLSRDAQSAVRDAPSRRLTPSWLLTCGCRQLTWEPNCELRGQHLSCRKLKWSTVRETSEFVFINTIILMRWAANTISLCSACPGIHF